MLSNLLPQQNLLLCLTIHEGLNWVYRIEKKWTKSSEQKETIQGIKTMGKTNLKK